MSIIAGAGTGAFTVGLSDTAAVAVSIGVSAAVNTITDTVEANIDDSTVTAPGGVSLSASTQAPQGGDSIKAVTVAGGLAVGVGNAVGTAFPFAGAGSGNTITDTVTASITGDSNVTATSGDVTLTATDDSSIDADGGGVTVAFAYGTIGVAAGAGAGKAVNTITNTTKAFIEKSTVTAQQVSLTAIATPSIVATAFGVAVSVSVGADASFAAAGSGADAENTINDTTYASIQDGSNVDATATGANAVYLSAQNTSSATAKSGAGSLGLSVNPVGPSASLAVGVVEANNNINDDIEAFITGTNTNVTSAGGVDVQATSKPTLQALGIAVSASLTIPVNPDDPVAIAASGDGAASKNTIGGKVYADIDCGSTVQANGGAVQVTATNTASINATLGTGAGSLGLFGLSVRRLAVHEHGEPRRRGVHQRRVSHDVRAGC